MNGDAVEGSSGGATFGPEAADWVFAAACDVGNSTTSPRNYEAQEDPRKKRFLTFRLRVTTFPYIFSWVFVSFAPSW